jgi:hypothetical protein
VLYELESRASEVVGRTVRFPEQEINMSAYSIVIADAGNVQADNNDGKVFVQASGSLKLITTAAKEGLAAIKGKSGEFFARVTETHTVAGEERRQVVKIDGDAEMVTLVVNKRLKDEKAQNAPAEATAQTTGADQSDMAGEAVASAL